MPVLDTPLFSSLRALPPRLMAMLQRWRATGMAGLLLRVGLALMLAGGTVLVLCALWWYPQLPSLDKVLNYQPQQALQVYTSDKVEIAQFGTERRDYLPIAQIPPLMQHAVVAVEDAAKRRALSELTGGQKHIAEAPLLLLWVADVARARLVAADAGAPAEGHDFLESFTVAAIDAALAAQNAVVAAESLGLGTVYIGALRNRPEDVAQAVGLPSGAVVVFGLVVGLPDPARPASVKPRLDQSVVLHRESYNLEGQRAGIAAYDGVAKAFQESQGQNPIGWRAQVLARSRDGTALHGRERLKAALRALGFPLR